MSAISFARMLLSQEITKQRNLIETDNKRKIEYDCNTDDRSYEFEHESIINDYRQRLKEYSKGNATDNQQKIITVILDNLTNNELVDMKHNDRLKFYSKQCGKSVWLVNETVKNIRKAQLYKGI